MPRFRYEGLDAGGQTVQGTLEASGREAALEKLGSQLNVVTSVAEVGSASGAPRLQGRLRAEELLTFTQEMAATVAAAVPIPDGLELVRRSSRPRSGLQAVAAELLQQVRGGTSLSSALSRQSGFNRFYVAAVQAAEAAGTLAPTLTSLARYVKRNEEMKARVKGALTYPLLVIGFTLLVSAFILTFGVAQLAGIYDGMGLQLPWLTRALVAVGRFFGAHWLVLCPLLVLGLGLLRRWLRSPRGERWLEALVLRHPLTGDLARDLMATRFAATLGMLSSSGVPIAQALELTAETMGNHLVTEQVRLAQRRVLEGQGLGAAVEACAALPDTLRGMVGVGEQSGLLGQTLGAASEYYEGRFETGIRERLTLLEPAVMIAVGMLVSVVIIALGLPFLTLSNTLG